MYCLMCYCCCFRAAEDGRPAASCVTEHITYWCCFGLPVLDVWMEENERYERSSLPEDTTGRSVTCGLWLWVESWQGWQHCSVMRWRGFAVCAQWARYFSWKWCFQWHVCISWCQCITHIKLYRSRKHVWRRINISNRCTQSSELAVDVGSSSTSLDDNIAAKANNCHSVDVSLSTETNDIANEDEELKYPAVDSQEISAVTFLGDENCCNSCITNENIDIDKVNSDSGCVTNDVASSGCENGRRDSIESVRTFLSLTLSVLVTVWISQCCVLYYLLLTFLCCKSNKVMHTISCMISLCSLFFCTFLQHDVTLVLWRTK